MAATARLLKSDYARYLPAPRSGQSVRLMASDGLYTERVWVDIHLVRLDESGRPTLFMGSVRSMSYNVDCWNYGDKIIFGPDHVQEIMGQQLY
jgi:hypothetical protein